MLPPARNPIPPESRHHNLNQVSFANRLSCVLNVDLKHFETVQCKPIARQKRCLFSCSLCVIKLSKGVTCDLQRLFAPLICIKSISSRKMKFLPDFLFREQVCAPKSLEQREASVRVNFSFRGVHRNFSPKQHRKRLCRIRHFSLRKKVKY